MSERLCIVPDIDLFVAVRNGKALVKTDEIAGIDERSAVLRSGRQLEAGILITATGLQIQALFGAMHITVGGRPGLPQQQLTCRDCCSRACSTSPGSNHRHDIN